MSLISGLDLKPGVERNPARVSIQHGASQTSGDVSAWGLEVQRAIVVPIGVVREFLE